MKFQHQLVRNQICKKSAANMSKDTGRYKPCGELMMILQPTKVFEAVWEAIISNLLCIAHGL